MEGIKGLLFHFINAIMIGKKRTVTNCFMICWSCIQANVRTISSEVLFRKSSKEPTISIENYFKCKVTRLFFTAFIFPQSINFIFRISSFIANFKNRNHKKLIFFLREFRQLSARPLQFPKLFYADLHRFPEIFRHKCSNPPNCFTSICCISPNCCGRNQPVVLRVYRLGIAWDRHQRHTKSRVICFSIEQCWPLLRIAC